MLRARSLVAVGLTAVVSAAGAQVASAAEGPTPQAVDAHAEFLAYAPPPPVPAKVCVVDTGVDLTTDAAPAIVERHSVFGGTTDDVGGSGLAKHGTLVAGVIASQLDGRDSVGIWPQARIVSVRVFAGSGGGTTVAAVVAGARALSRAWQRDRESVSRRASTPRQSDELAWLATRIATLRDTWNINVVAAVGNNGGSGWLSRHGSRMSLESVQVMPRGSSARFPIEATDLTSRRSAVASNFPGREEVSVWETAPRIRRPLSAR